VDYWWPGENAPNTTDYLLAKHARYMGGEKLVMEDIMTTLKNTLDMDQVPLDMRPRPEQVKNWFARHKYKARM